MYLVFIVIIGVIIVGIILLGNQSPVRKKSREEFLKELTEFLYGQSKQMEGEKNCCQISFNFEGQDFVFEDIEENLFGSISNKASLRTKTATHITLHFSEKEKSMRICSDVLIVSDIKEKSGQPSVQVQVPKGLEELKIMTSNPEEVNKFFEDKKVVQIFAAFKNINNRGGHSLALKIVEGEVILDFYSDNHFNPSLEILHKNIPSMEDYLDQMLLIVRKLNSLEK